MRLEIKCQHCGNIDEMHFAEDCDGRDKLIYTIRNMEFPYLCEACREKWKGIEQKNKENLEQERKEFLHVQYTDKEV